jgi:predicted SnoaL-like aldol condensation-catalyzing enzyme
MKSYVYALLLLIGPVGISAAQIPEPKCDPVPQSRLDANKQLLLDFFDSRQLSPEERSERFQTDDYTQHNPRFLKLDEQTRASGRRAWVRAYQETVKRGIKGVELNGIPLENPPVIIMAECDLVTAIYRGTLKDPDDPSRTYEAFAFETVRVRDGKFSEHWDQVTLAPGWMKGGR